MSTKENLTVDNGPKRPVLHKSKSGVRLKSLFGRKGTKDFESGELSPPPTLPGHNFSGLNDITEARGIKFHATTGSGQSSIIDVPFPVPTSPLGLGSEDLAMPAASMPAKFMARQHLRAQLDQAHFAKVQAIAKKNAASAGDGDQSSGAGNPDPASASHQDGTSQVLSDVTPHLEVQLPQVEMDRYSVMFEKLLEPKQTILERRGTPVKHKVNIPREESDSTLGTYLDSPNALPRSGTMPNLISPSLLNVDIIDETIQEVARPVEMRRAFGIIIGGRPRSQTDTNSRATSPERMHDHRHQQATCINHSSDGSETSVHLWSEASDMPATPDTTTGMSTCTSECIDDAEDDNPYDDHPYDEHREDEHSYEDHPYDEHSQEEHHSFGFGMVLDLEWDDELEEASFKEPDWETLSKASPPLSRAMTPISRIMTPPVQVLTVSSPSLTTLPPSTFGVPSTVPTLPQSTFTPSTPLRTPATRRRATEASQVHVQGSRARKLSQQSQAQPQGSMSLSALERKNGAVANLAHENDKHRTPTRSAVATSRPSTERLNPLGMNAPRGPANVKMGVAKQVSFGVSISAPTTAESNSRGRTGLAPMTTTATAAGGDRALRPGVGVSELVSMYSRQGVEPEPLSIYSKQPVKPRVVEVQPRQSTAVVLDNTTCQSYAWASKENLLSPRLAR